jgi:hypothetical protein
LKATPKYSTAVSGVTLEMSTDEFLMIAGCLGAMKASSISQPLYDAVTKAREDMGLKRKYEGTNNGGATFLKEIV